MDHDKRGCSPGKAARLVRLIFFGIGPGVRGNESPLCRRHVGGGSSGQSGRAELRNIHAIVFDLPSVRLFDEATGRVFLGGEPQLPVS